FAAGGIPRHEGVEEASRGEGSYSSAGLARAMRPGPPTAPQRPGADRPPASRQKCPKGFKQAGAAPKPILPGSPSRFAFRLRSPLFRQDDSPNNRSKRKPRRARIPAMLGLASAAPPPFFRLFFPPPIQPPDIPRI